MNVSSGDGGEADTTPGLAAAAAEVEGLGQRFYPSAARYDKYACVERIKLI